MASELFEHGYASIGAATSFLLRSQITVEEFEQLPTHVLDRDSIINGGHAIVTTVN